MRTLVIKRDADLEALRSELLVSGLSDSRSGAALESIRTLNPHLDFERLKPGMVLLVPDAPDFRKSDTKPVGDEPLEDFEHLVRDGLEAARAKLRAGGEKRALRRGEMSEALKSPALKRAIKADPDLAKRIELVSKRTKDEEKDDAHAQKMLDDAADEIRSELTALAKLLR